MSVSMMAGQRTGHYRARRRLSRAALHIFLIALAFIFAWPLLYAVYCSLRPYGEVVANPNGFFSTPATLNLGNYLTFWNSANYPHFFWNTMIITLPAIALTLWASSMMAFAISKFSWRFNLLVLMIFTAGNLLPPQVIIVPLYRLYTMLPVPAPFSDNGIMYDQVLGLILIHATFQTGFCTFVLSNYMKTLSKELVEAAQIDGAGIFTIYLRVILPLVRPAMAALGTLLFVWIYNDFFWSLMLFKSGDKRPITAALNNLSGTYFTDPTLVAAGSIMAAIPTVLIYLALQRYFVSGLTLGSAKG
ncbi:MAG TPA: carbohydrate ABC transporter permease [Candidatus Limnocylindrales bacterium]